MVFLLTVLLSILRPLESSIGEAEGVASHSNPQGDDGGILSREIIP